MPGEDSMRRRSAKRKWKARARRRQLARDRNNLRVGDAVDFKQFLFHPGRNYLIKNNNVHVRAEQLEGKVVVLYFVSVKHIHLWVWKHTKFLVDVYTELVSLSRPFEVVFVAVTDEHDDPAISGKYFQDLFTIMPWTAIPFSDAEARRLLEKSFVDSELCGTYNDLAIVISETGVVLQKNALLLMRSFGAAGYPFSRKSLQCLKCEDEEARASPSLKNLLVSPERDYVINNKGDKVSICDLEDKVVALFLYEEGWTKKLTETLRDAYRHWVEEKKMNFEVVLIYVSDSWHTIGDTNVDTFQKLFETMPWLAIPYNDRNCKKLMRVLQYPFELGVGLGPDPSLVIIGPHGEFFEPWGSRILMNFGIDAYPWTTDKVGTLQVEQVKKIDLHMLFSPETVFMRESESQQVRFPDIVGRRIVVFCDYARYHSVYDEFRMKLQKKYLESKGKDDEFEVIHLDVCNRDKLPFQWLRLHRGYNYDYNLPAAQKIFTINLRHNYGILAFDVDGKIVRATSHPTFESEDIGFPFYSGSFEEEVVEDTKRRLYN